MRRVAAKSFILSAFYFHSLQRIEPFQWVALERRNFLGRPRSASFVLARRLDQS
jgi:hypothetical protein